MAVEYLTEEEARKRVAPSYGDVSRVKYLSEEEAVNMLPRGAVASKPLPEAHPELSTTERMLIQNIAENVSPEVSHRRLRQTGWEFGRTPEGEISLRRPGEQEWRMLDPPSAEWADLLDVGGGALRFFEMALGGALGTAGGTAVGGPWGGVAGGAGGAAVGEAAAQGQLQTIGELAGLDMTPGEAATGLVEAAATGGVTELGGRAVMAPLKYAGRTFQRAAATAPRTSEEIAGELGRRATGVRQAGELAGAERGMFRGRAALKAAAEAGDKEAERALGKKLTGKALEEETQAALQREAVKRLSNQPGAERAIRAKRSMAERVMRESGSKPFGVLWRKKRGRLRAGRFTTQGPKFLSQKELARLPEEELRRKAHQLMGPQAHRLSREALIKRGAGQPGFVKGTGTPIDRAKNPHLRRVWDVEAGGWRFIDLDTIAKMKPAHGKAIDFTKPSRGGKILRSLFPRMAGKGKPLGKVEQKLVRGLRKIEATAPGRAERIARHGILGRTGRLGTMILGGQEMFSGGGFPGTAVSLAVAARLGRPLAAGAVRRSGSAAGRAASLLSGDTTGATVGRVSAAAPPGLLKRLFQQVLQARDRGPDAYKAAIWVLTNNPEFRRWIQSEEGRNALGLVE